MKQPPREGMIQLDADEKTQLPMGGHPRHVFKPSLGMVCIGVYSTRSEGCWVFFWTSVVGKRWDGFGPH